MRRTKGLDSERVELGKIARPLLGFDCFHVDICEYGDGAPGNKNHANRCSSSVLNFGFWTVARPARPSLTLSQGEIYDKPTFRRGLAE